MGCGGVARTLAQQGGVAFDDAEDVVEAMGDAAGNLADEFHFARLEGIIFAAAHLREIGDPADYRFSIAENLTWIIFCPQSAIVAKRASSGCPRFQRGRE